MVKKLFFSKFFGAINHEATLNSSSFITHFSRASHDLEAMPEGIEPTGEIDLRALGAALRRKLRLLLAVALAACLLIALVVNVVTARYTAQSQVLLENQETFFTRPDRVNVQQVDQVQQLDPEAVASQVQLIASRDIARRAIKQLGLEGNDEFDPKINPFKRVLIRRGRRAIRAS